MMLLLIFSLVGLGNAIIFIGGFLSVRDAHGFSERIPAALLYSVFVVFMLSIDISFIRGILLD